MTQTIALMSDFGIADIYVGVMKGVIRQICPPATLIDITHNINPQHVRQAAFSLLNAYRYFPRDTIFLVVVDPGVGTSRYPIAVRADGYTFVAPDNGVLSYVLSEMREITCVELSNPDYQLADVSMTFHGRDIFAPAAAHLAAGVHFNDLGSRLERLVQLPAPVLSNAGRRIAGEVMDIDRFGNIISSIGHLRWGAPGRLTLMPAFGDKLPTVPIRATDAVITIHDQQIITVSTSYGETVRGQLLALVGSTGYLEIAVNQGNAASRLDVEIGDRVEIEIGDIDAAIRY